MGCAKRRVCVLVFFLLAFMQLIVVRGMSYQPAAKIIVNLPSCTLEYYEGNHLIKEYPVAIGKPSTPTPRGFFSIVEKEANPCWYPPNKKGVVVQSGPDNPLGYRWMGFKGNYGIHGTNEPWAIGSTVSNGCIRMYEEDVEELFHQVPYHTPISITYERVKVRINEMGKASISIYPDVYGVKPLTIEKVKEKLQAEQMSGLMDDDFLEELIVKAKGNPVIVANLYHIIIDNKEVEEYLVSWGDVLYAPVVALSERLGKVIEWDEEKQLVISNHHTVAGIFKNNVLYVAVNDLPQLFNIRESWDKYHHCLRIHTLELWRPGPTVTYQLQLVDDSLYVPLTQVAKVLGKKLNWDTDQTTIWLGCRKINVKILVGEPYVEVNKISEYFNASITLNMALNIVDIHYFCWPVDNSMYLGEMADVRD